MRTTLLIFVGLLLSALVAIAAVGMYKFNYLSGQPGYDVDGNKIEETKDTVAITPTDTPSRAPYEDCVWEKVKGAGIEFWGQHCTYNGHTMRVAVSETLSGAFLEEMTPTGPVAMQNYIQIFALPTKNITDTLSIIRTMGGWSDADACAFTKDERNSTADVTRYILMPTGVALEQFTRDSHNEPITSTCGGYGMGNSGIQYFEVHASNPGRALFLTLGQDAPLFDESTIVVR